MVAESVHDGWRNKVSRSDEQICRVNAENGCVEKLEERDQYGCFPLDAIPESFIHVMKMSYKSVVHTC